MDTAEPVRIEDLLLHADWLRRLAASLVQGGAAADDLVQDTWMAALEHPPHGGAPVRPWLARIARNLALNRRRGDARRSDRESFAGTQRDTSAPSPSRIVEEVEAQRTLADLVLALDEPLRTTVVLRYFRGLDASEISRLQGAPAGTVRWRLKQALDRLREELDVRFGRREAWCVAFGELLARDAATSIATGAALKSSLALGGTVVSSGTKIGIAATLVALVAGVWSLWRLEPEPAVEPIVAANVGTASMLDTAPAEARVPTPPPAESRSPAPTTTTTSPSKQFDLASLAVPPAMEGFIVGRVRDARGAPLPGVTVGVSSPAVEDSALLETNRRVETSFSPRTFDDGTFALPVPKATPIHLVFTHGDHAPRMSGPWFAGDSFELVLDAGATLHVRVHAKNDGKPMPGTLVSAAVVANAASKPWHVEMRTGADGTSSCTGVPRGTIRVSAVADGFASDASTVEVEGTERVDVSFELTSAGVLAGIVHDAASGAPIAGAKVAGHDAGSTTTDASGRFHLATFPLDGATRTVAVTAAGHAPAHAEVHFDEARRAEHVELALAPEQRVRGRIVDETGQAVAGADVVCSGSVSTMPFVRTGVEASAITDADGRFELRGLASAHYSLVARAPGLAPTVERFDATSASDAAIDLGDIVAAAAAEIEGSIDDVASEPRELVVRLHLAEGGGDLLHVGTTCPDKRRRFAFANLPPGRYELSLVRARDDDSGAEEQTLASTTVVLAAGETSRDVVLRGGQAAIEGVVVAPAGVHPFTVHVTGGALDAAGARTDTDAEGRFRFWVDGSGPFRVTVSDPRLFCAPKSVEGVRRGDRALRIELEPFRSTHVIRGRLVGSSSEPIESTYVAFIDTTTGERLGRVAMPDEHGRFEMKDLNDVPYHVELFDMKSRYLPLRIESVKPNGADVEMRIVRRGE